MVQGSPTCPSPVTGTHFSEFQASPPSLAQAAHFCPSGQSCWNGSHSAVPRGVSSSQTKSQSVVAPLVAASVVCAVASVGAVSSPALEVAVVPAPLVEGAPRVVAVAPSVSPAAVVVVA